MHTPCIDCHYIGPVVDITLVRLVISHSHYGAVAAKADGEVISCTDCHNIGPATDIAMAILVISHSHYGAITAKTDGVISACTDCHNIGPAADIALAIAVISHSHCGAVATKTNDVCNPCIDCHYIGPVVDNVLATVVMNSSRADAIKSNHSAIVAKADGEVISCTNRYMIRDLIPQCKTALSCILIICDFAKSNCCFCCSAFGQKFFCSSILSCNLRFSKQLCAIFEIT